MKFLRNLGAESRRDCLYLVRSSFDVENLNEDFRLIKALQTLNFILRRNGRVIILAHRGRPKGKDLKLSLRPLIPFLEKNLRKKVTFFSDFDFKQIARVIQHSSESVFLLENLRFLSEEEENNDLLAKELAGLGEVYINDDFAASHRKHTSLYALPKLLPRYAGLQLEDEIIHLSKILNSAEHPLLVIVGGAKVPEKMDFLWLISKTADTLIAGGVVANTLLYARGDDIGASLYESDALPLANKLIQLDKLVLPVDFVMEDDKIKDIGDKSSEIFVAKISHARTIIWNGVMGLFEDKRFAYGSEAVLRAIAASSAFSVVGGGETTCLVRNMKLEDKISFLSTGGGAMLEFLGGKKLPGLEALN